jgi:hypothetical protein
MYNAVVFAGLALDTSPTLQLNFTLNQLRVRISRAQQKDVVLRKLRSRYFAGIQWRMVRRIRLVGVPCHLTPFSLTFFSYNTRTVHYSGKTYGTLAHNVLIVESSQVGEGVLLGLCCLSPDASIHPKAQIFEESLNKTSLEWSGRMFARLDLHHTSGHAGSEYDEIVLPVVKTRKKRDPNKPQGYMSGFNFFAKEHRANLLEKEPELQNQSTNTNLMNKLLGTVWKNMSKQERTKYEEMAVADKCRYLKVRRTC